MAALPNTYQLTKDALTPNPEGGQKDALDHTGIWASLLCLIHCVGIPLLTLIIPALESLPENDALIHSIALLLIVPIAALSFIKGYKIHKISYVPVLGALGVGLLILAFLWEETALHSIMTSIGGIILVTGHMLNLRLNHQLQTNCKRCTKKSTPC